MYLDTVFFFCILPHSSHLTWQPIFTHPAPAAHCAITLILLEFHTCFIEMVSEKSSEVVFGCGSVWRVLAYHAEAPECHPQCHRSWVCCHALVILVLRTIKLRNTDSGIIGGHVLFSFTSGMHILIVCSSSCGSCF